MPTLPTAISNRLENIAKHSITLEIELAEFTGPKSFTEAYNSTDPGKVRIINSLERAFEIIQNHIAELVRISLIQLDLRRRSDPSNARKDFELLADHGYITLKLKDTLSKLQAIRNLIAHDYIKIEPKTIFNSAHTLLTTLPPFLSKYRKLLQELGY